MHELALMGDLVSAVEAQIEGRIRAVRLEVGALSCVMPDALRFCFDVCAQGTRLEGATLQIHTIAALGRCRACGAELALDGPVTPCPCGSVDVEVLAGHELRVREVEVE